MQPFQEIDRSEWSLHDFVLEGEIITWEVQETETLESHNRLLGDGDKQFWPGDSHDHFLIWYFELKNHLDKNGYFVPTHPDFSKVAPLRVAGRVPRIRELAVETKGIGYGDPLSKKSQKLFQNIREETDGILKILNDIMPELQVRDAEDYVITKGKKRLYLPKFKETDWAKITLHFTDEQGVVIITDKKQLPSDYKALGFADDKRGKPNSAWGFLLGLARNNGETKTLPSPIPDTIKQQKSLLARNLKNIFKNNTDPFYDSTETHTYRIKITLIPPHTEDPPGKLGIKEYLTETMIEE